MRKSLDQGFKNFSFGNVWIGTPSMSNEDFYAKDENGLTFADKVASMSPTGNRVLTNTDVKVELEVPERTQSYDQWLKTQRDEFFMSLADPSLKLGIEEGFTKATAETAAAFNKYKISTMRRHIKQVFEDLFDQILDSLGYDYHKANVELNFGPEETAEYVIADVLAAQAQDIILPNEARHLLRKYRKWDIEDKIEGGDETNAEKAKALATTKTGAVGEPTAEKPKGISQQLSAETKETRAQARELAAESDEHSVLGKYQPQMINNVPLKSGLVAYDKKMTKFYLDPEVPVKYYAILTAGAQYEYSLLENGVGIEKASWAAKNFERLVAVQEKMDYQLYQQECAIVLAKVKARNSPGPEDVYQEWGN
jgi:hypothetical protein